MFLSKLELNRRSNQVQSELRDPYQMHRTLSKAFGDNPEVYEESRCLFRVDERADSGDPVVLVQSMVRPEWSRLTVSSDYMAAPPLVKESSPALRSGQLLNFRLRVNPTVKRDGKRLGLYREEEQISWLMRKSGICGFKVVSAVPKGSERSEFKTAEGKLSTFSSVMFEGTLAVTDPEAFLNALESGIGSAKAFGFGLLSIAQAR